MVVRAFSLIEVMVASALLSVGLAAILTAFSSAASLGAHQERLTVGMHLAEARMEELLLLYPDDEALTFAPHTALKFSRTGTSVSAASAAYYDVSWTIGNGPLARTRRVDVTVTWTEPGGPQRIVFTSHRS